MTSGAMAEAGMQEAAAVQAGKSILRVRMAKTPFDVPRVIFTLKGNVKSEGVIAELVKLNVGVEGQEYRIFETPDDVRAYFQSGVSPSAAVVLFDGTSGRRNFGMLTRSRASDMGHIPSWASGAQWAVQVFTGHRFLNCARQLRADYRKHFTERLATGNFPWGLPRKGEHPPAHVVLPEHTASIVERLNAGPDLAAAIAHTEHAAELPTGSKISWVRVSPDPITVDAAYLTIVVQALRRFEWASGILAAQEEVHPFIFAGVTLRDGTRLQGLYLKPPRGCFSVTRPDLHYTGEGLFASEIDEMPGGLPELAHIDRAYGLNQERWQKFFTWLSGEGAILFLVSHDWSKCYIPETAWLVEHMRSLGYPAEILTTDRLDELTIEPSGVSFRGARIGTIWRQFPIFETTGKLVDLVDAAREGVVRMVPEFAHYGNKVWFSLYRRYRPFYMQVLKPAEIEILDAVLPDSHLITSSTSFPCTVAGHTIGSLEDLVALPDEFRNRMVLKICGANALAARSYGVLMGHGLSADTWRGWIEERLRERQPFIAQRRLETGVARVAVHNTKSGAAELFDCRILLRPWVMNGEIISVHCCAVPSNTLRVHGRVDMAILPVELGEVTS